MSVLVVDDHPDVADFIAESLRDLEGMDVETVHSAEEAEARARQKPYDLFIVDLYLRGDDFSADGLAFAKWVRKKHPDAKVILMTGKSYSTRSLDASEAGSDSSSLTDVEGLIGVCRLFIGVEGETTSSNFQASRTHRRRLCQVWSEYQE